MPQPASQSDRQQRRRAALSVAALVAAVALTVGTCWLGVSSYHVPEERKELESWHAHVFTPLHHQTRSLQAALAGLVDETAPRTAAKAVLLLDNNVLPALQLLVEELRQVRFDTLDVRALHSGYFEAVVGMQEDAQAMRAIFAEPGAALGDQRARVQARMSGTLERFDRVYARARELYREHGLGTAASAPAPALDDAKAPASEEGKAPDPTGGGAR